MLIIISQVRELIGWTKSIGGKFFRLVPFYTAAIIMTTNIAKVSQILSMLLPLKILMILSSDSIPAFFPAIISHSDIRTWVLCLSVLAAACYIIYISSQRLVTYWSERASRHLLKSSAKISLFSNQDKIAADSYLKYSQLLSGALFVSVLYFLIWYLYLEIMLLLSVYVLITIISLICLARFRPHMLDNVVQRLTGLGTIFSATGFMLVFSFMVHDYLSGSEKNFLASIIVLLVSRIWLSQLSLSIIGVLNLHRNKFQLHSLFFHGRLVETAKNDKQTNFFKLLESKSRSKWIGDFINDCSEITYHSFNVEWIELGLTGVAAFEVDALENDGEIVSRFFIKAYDQDKHVSARQEVELLQEVESDFPSLTLLTSGEINDCAVILYSLEGMRKLTPYEAAGKLDEFKKCLVSNHPATSFVERYLRSKVSLQDRLRSESFEGLQYVITDSNDEIVLHEFKKRLPYLQSMLAELPYYVYCPLLIHEGFYIDTRNRPILAHWFGWRLESLGAGWHTSETALLQLEQAIDEFCDLNRNNSPTRVVKKQVVLSAMCFDLEQMLMKWKFTNALSLMANINLLLSDSENLVFEEDAAASMCVSAV